MDTPRKDGYRVALILVITMTISVRVCASNKDALSILRQSYMLPSNSSTEDMEEVISDLEQAAGLCDDKQLKARINYRIGILYFRDSSLEKALGHFRQALQMPNCDELVMMCSLNMTAQICRMKAKDNEALDAFQELIELSDRHLPVKSASVVEPPAALKLNITAGFSRAEIYQYHHKYDSAVSEYERILSTLQKNKTPDANSYMPLAMDRISQLNLMSGNIKGFQQATRRLIEEYPDYYRTPVVRFEAEAVKILKDRHDDAIFPTGSSDAPARLILIVKEANDKELAEKAIALLEDLSQRYKGTYGVALLRYHQGCLLDAIGQKEEAKEAFESVRKDAAANVSKEIDVTTVTETLAAYAILQRALILSEANDYRDALSTVSLVKTDPNDIHLQNLAKTIKEALETLRNEVPQSAINQ